jgi:DNA replication and repair protein RecF
LVSLGSEIIDQRNGLADELREPVRSAYRSVAGADHGPQLTMQLSVLGAVVDDDDAAPTASGKATPVTSQDGVVETEARTTAAAFAAALADVRRRELERGITLIGPHRDDVLFELNGLPAKGYASHGESWSFALALKLASADLLRHESPLGDPVLILDDVFAELDQSRRRMLAESIRGYEQVLITAAVLEDVPPHLRENTVHISAGSVVVDDEAAVRADE